MKLDAQVIAVFLGLLWIVLAPSLAHAQSEIDPDHFDSPNTEPVPQPRTADSKTTMTRYDGAFSLPYSALCNGKKLAPGKYSIAIRFDGKAVQATLNQKGQAVQIAGTVKTHAPKQRDEVVVVETNKNGRMLTVFQVCGFDFVLDSKRSAGSSPDSKPVRSEKLLLTAVVPNEIVNQAPAPRSPKR